MSDLLRTTPTEALTLDYQKSRDFSNLVARELERRGLVGQYRQPEEDRWKPLKPDTRPTEFRFVHRPTVETPVTSLDDRFQAKMITVRDEGYLILFEPVDPRKYVPVHWVVDEEGYGLSPASLNRHLVRFG